MALTKFQRASQVAEILLKYGLDEFFERSGLESWLPKSLVKQLSNEEMRGISVYERIRRAMEELGTTYVKLGQMLSDRRDLLPEALIAELQKLQDKVEVQQIDIKEKLQRELNIDVEEHFAELATKPLASASIGQVFKAQLKNGQEVVLKVKREGIDERVNLDLAILEDLIVFFERHNEMVRNLQARALLDAFKKMLTEELSYHHERRYIERFAANFQGDEAIIVPKTYAHLSNNMYFVWTLLRARK